MSEYDYLFKVIVVGDGAVGKTAITIRFAEGRFEEHYKMTIGVDFAIKLLEIEGYKVKLQVWDTGGQERFSYIRPLYYKGAMAAIAIFDLTNRESFDNLPKWMQEVAENCGGIPLMLVGNKSDLPDRAVTTAEGQSFADKLGIDYYEASAKNGANIHSLFLQLGTKLLKSKIPALAGAPTTPAISSTPTPPPPVFEAKSAAITEVKVRPSPPIISPPKAPAISAPPKFTPPQPKVVTPSKPITPTPPPQPKFVPSSSPPKITSPSSAPMPAIFTPKPIKLEEDPLISSLDEALEILEVNEINESEPPEPIFTSSPPSMAPIELETIDFEPSPPQPEPEPFSLSPTVPVPSSSSPPSLSPHPTFGGNLTPIPDVEEEVEEGAFVPFIAGPIQDKPKTISTGPTGTWIDFLKKQKVEEDKSTIVPFLLSDYTATPSREEKKKTEKKEVIIEVINQIDDEDKKRKDKKKEKDKKKDKSKEGGSVCPSCHKVVPGGWRFCTYCGQSLN